MAEQHPPVVGGSHEAPPVMADMPAVESVAQSSGVPGANQNNEKVGWFQKFVVGNNNNIYKEDTAPDIAHNVINPTQQTAEVEGVGAHGGLEAVPIDHIAQVNPVEDTLTVHEPTLAPIPNVANEQAAPVQPMEEKKEIAAATSFVDVPKPGAVSTQEYAPVAAAASTDMVPQDITPAPVVDTVNVDASTVDPAPASQAVELTVASPVEQPTVTESTPSPLAESRVEPVTLPIAEPAPSMVPATLPTVDVAAPVPAPEPVVVSTPVETPAAPVQPVVEAPAPVAEVATVSTDVPTLSIPAPEPGVGTQEASATEVDSNVTIASPEPDAGPFMSAMRNGVGEAAVSDPATNMQPPAEAAEQTVAPSMSEEIPSAPANTSEEVATDVAPVVSPSENTQPVSSADATALEENVAPVIPFPGAASRVEAPQNGAVATSENVASQASKDTETQLDAAETAELDEMAKEALSTLEVDANRARAILLLSKNTEWMQDEKEVETVLEEIKAKGPNISLEDFGKLPHRGLLINVLKQRERDMNNTRDGRRSDGQSRRNLVILANALRRLNKEEQLPKNVISPNFGSSSTSAEPQVTAHTSPDNVVNFPAPTANVTDQVAA